eukprot:scaffold198015_cov31-Tisochrysis_lutea.AAC.2
MWQLEQLVGGRKRTHGSFPQLNRGTGDARCVRLSRSLIPMRNIGWQRQMIQPWRPANKGARHKITMDFMKLEHRLAKAASGCCAGSPL